MQAGEVAITFVDGTALDMSYKHYNGVLNRQLEETHGQIAYRVVYADDEYKHKNLLSQIRRQMERETRITTIAHHEKQLRRRKILSEATKVQCELSRRNVWPCDVVLSPYIIAENDLPLLQRELPDGTTFAGPMANGSYHALVQKAE